MATTPFPQTSPLTRELLAAGVLRMSADGTTILKPDGTAFAVASEFEQGAAVANATDEPSAVTQLNALLASLRAAGTIAT
jgi:hypothetical protein